MEILLSKQDPRELPKGSKDPLGFEILWTQYGRRTIGNLTTITGSIDEFLTALFGFYLSETVDDDEHVHRFIRYEQVAGYLRQYTEKGGFVRGVSRVKERLKQLENGSIPVVTISKSKRDMILSSQSAYGLWGLYSTALDVSGLIEDRKTVNKGRELAEIMAVKDKALTLFLQRFIEKDEQVLNLSDIEKFAPKFLLLLNETYKKELLEILLYGSEEKKIQHDFFEYLKKHDDELSDSLDDIWKIINHIIISNDAPISLKQVCSDIVQLDSVLALANNLFDYMRLPENEGETLNDIVLKIEEKQPEQYRLELPLDLAKDKVVQFAQMWNTGSYESALSSILKLHEDVVHKQRGSAPWVELDDRKELKIRVESPRATLDVSMKHHYSYFLDSYLRMYRAYRKIAS